MGLPDLSAIRQALSDQIVRVADVRCYPFIPDAPETPCVVVGVDDPYLNPHLSVRTFGMSLRLIVMVAGTNSRSAQLALDDLVVRVCDAVEAVSTVNGQVLENLGLPNVSVSVTSVSGPRAVDLDQVSYPAHEIAVRVIAGRI